MEIKIFYIPDKTEPTESIIMFRNAFSLICIVLTVVHQIKINRAPMFVKNIKKKPKPF